MKETRMPPALSVNKVANTVYQGNYICHVDKCFNAMQNQAFHKPSSLFSSFYLDPCHTFVQFQRFEFR